MSQFLNELFEKLDEPVNEHDDEITDTVEDTVQDDEVEVEEIEHDDEAEEIVEVEETPEASEETEAEDDDETDEHPKESKKVSEGRLNAILAERDKRQAAVEEAKAAIAARDKAVAELAEMRRQQADFDAQNLPNPYDDPTGFVAAKEAQFQQQMMLQSLNFGIERATAKHGVEEVEKAVAWFDSQAEANPGIPLRENMMKQSDQVEYVVNSYKQAQQMQALSTGDYSALVAELQKAGFHISKAETQTATAPAVPVTPIATAPAIVPVAPAPAAPKRSKLATSSGATTAPAKDVSFMDAVLRNRT